MQDLGHVTDCEGKEDDVQDQAAGGSWTDDEHLQGEGDKASRMLASDNAAAQGVAGGITATMLEGSGAAPPFIEACMHVHVHVHVHVQTLWRCLCYRMPKVIQVCACHWMVG
eukprot:365528-Chlamydomonas_euryale.AAC.4